LAAQVDRIIKEFLTDHHSRELLALNPNYIAQEEVQRLLAEQKQHSRPIAWEDDISRNTLDEKPFENQPPIQSLSDSFVGNPSYQQLERKLGAERLLEMIRRDSFPIPSTADREGYSPGYDLNYWLSGLEDFLKVQDFVHRFSIDQKAVLDFGCASGRLIRHFAAQTEIAEIWGSDINARHIRWLQEFLPDRVKPVFNHALPMLPLRDNSVDVITAFSVFTHIDTFETCWLAELSRILRDDGLLYVTVHDESTWELLRTQLDNPDNRLIQSILKIDPSVATKINEPLADTRTVYRFSQSGPYRAQVFHSRNYLRNVWGRFFCIEDILPAHHNRQTVVAMRKK
jgi:ubiquinone/menaquinone biosynthesis C-methylase UbiE